MVLYSFFWVITRHLNFICRRFGTLCSIFIDRVNKAHKGGTKRFETSTYKIQTTGNHPKEKIKHSQHGESLKSRSVVFNTYFIYCVLLKKSMNHAYIYRVSQEECEILRESVPYVKLYRYNPKHLYPKFNGYGDKDHRKMWASGESTNCSCP